MSMMRYSELCEHTKRLIAIREVNSVVAYHYMAAGDMSLYGRQFASDMSAEEEIEKIAIDLASQYIGKTFEHDPYIETDRVYSFVNFENDLPATAEELAALEREELAKAAPQPSEAPPSTTSQAKRL